MSGGDVVDVIGAVFLMSGWLIGYQGYRIGSRGLASRWFFLSATGALLVALAGILAANILSRSDHDRAATILDFATGLAALVILLWFLAYAFRREKRPGQSL
jgi:hypothetical protein